MNTVTLEANPEERATENSTVVLPETAAPRHDHDPRRRRAPSPAGDLLPASIYALLVHTR